MRSSRAVIWGSAIAVYVLFTFWYTDFSGPLDEAEIRQYMERMLERGASPEAIEGIEKFMREDTGRQFLMINILDLEENPGDVAGAEPGESSQQLMARYMGYMFPAMLSRASHPAFFGDAVHRSLDIVGIENAEFWEQAGIVRYRSRRTFMDIVANPEQGNSHTFKVAALAKTIAFPVEPTLYPNDLRFLLALVLVAAAALLDNLRLSRLVRQR